MIYDEALAMLGLPAAEVAAVGDSMEHDVGGAAAAGVDSVFVLGGIHRGDVGLLPAGRQGAAPPGTYSFSRAGLEDACSAAGVAPTFVMPYFAW